ncbi:MAG: HAMP domain-containing protein [Spirochaetaceae bacterium]|jgi:adenylate cyclase|nr:HAMP domain-containing protein [Spirochaetaceae bacterium]
MFIIVGLLALSLGAITFMASTLISMDVRITAEHTNFSINAQAAEAAKSFLSVNKSAALTFLRTWRALPATEERDSLADYFFAENDAVAALAAGTIGGGETGGGGISGGAFTDESVTLINDRFFLSREADRESVAFFLNSRRDYLARAAGGETLVLNGTGVFNIPVLVMLLPGNGLLKNGVSQPGMTALFLSSETVTQNFGDGPNGSCLINGEGDILADPDTTLGQEGRNLRTDPLVLSMYETGETRKQRLYTGSDGIRRFGAYTKLDIAGLAVITTIDEKLVFEETAATTTRNIWLSAGVLFISILCVWFFSKTISEPLKNLSAAAGKIKEGNFNITLQSRRRDEIGLLTESFVEMSRGLAERERLKDTFGRFINREIAERAIKGELELGGENRQATVLFSDIRDFTSISEKMPAQDVVGFLNSYLSRMVSRITKTGGVVDKFIGDAIMAIWGVPVSTGNFARDALACVRSALMMRIALQEYNQTRGAENRPYLKIGCGINTGDVVAGQIGSKERMEYTVIGDTVNLASRTEALNKPFCTDILITEHTWNLVKDYVITEEMPGVTVKGKAAPVRMFAVVNLRIKKPGMLQPKPVSLAQLREQLGLDIPDLDAMERPGIEKKYKIHD